MKQGKKYSKEVRDYIIRLRNEKVPYKEIVARTEAEFSVKVPMGTISSTVHSYKTQYNNEKSNIVYITKEELQKLIDNKPVAIKIGKQTITLYVTVYCCKQYSQTMETKYGKRLLKASKFCPFCGNNK